jgi:hypothetical protein
LNRNPVEGTHITHNTVDIAVYIVDLTERTPSQIPGLDIDQLLAARKLAAGDIESGDDQTRSQIIQTVKPRTDHPGPYQNCRGTSARAA